jgi:hypothetical protein
MKVKDRFLGYGSFQINNGKNTRFWEDTWIGSTPLQHKYPHLYRIVRHKHTSVASVLSTVPLNISFRRSLLGNTLQSWHKLVATIANVRLNDREDIFRWGLNQNGMFTVRIMYNTWMSGNIWENRLIWKLKLPLKIKNFLWYLSKGVTLTKDNLVRRIWMRNTKCVFCTCEETIQHLFFDCRYASFLWRALQFTFGIHRPASINDLFTNWLLGIGLKSRKQILVEATALCWAIWTSRNDIIFDNSPMKTYMQVVYRATYWCRLWVLLQTSEEDNNKMKDACRAIEAMIMQIFTNREWCFRNRLE